LQISLQNTFNQTTDALSITITPEEIREIEAQAEPVRQSVKEMYSHYKKDRRSGEEQFAADSAVLMEVREKFANYRPDSGNGAPG
jgi:hypothetical protein